MTSESSFRVLSRETGNLFVILGVASLILLMVLPVPPILMDILLVLSIAFSIIIFLVGFYIVRPLDFSVFPTMILFATLLRLTLNIASTRLILLNGSNGEGAAGEVIRAFGFFVAGGNYVVGFIVFIILVIVNFVVITKGAGRIAEVAARFTLDSMPGKQLAIDADLNSGIINDKEALRRRETLEREADFYGAMDGASKFVRGDAIAGILIVIVNVVGGLIIGMAQNGMNLIDAVKIYTLLSIGDGLVSQIPALIVSVSAGLIVTKVSKSEKLADEIGRQAMMQWKPLMLASLLLITLGMVPGLPRIPFWVIGLALGYAGYRIHEKEKAKALNAQMAIDLGHEGGEAQVAEKADAVPPMDLLELEVGYDLVSLVDQKSGGEFPSRIIGIRRQLAGDMGVILPPVHIRDNLKLKPAEYRIFLRGAVLGKGELLPHHSLALDPGMTTRRVEGIPTKDPTFGLAALWIPDERKEEAVIAGYTVVDLASVMATHLAEIVRKNLHELFGRQELAVLLDQLKTTHPRVVSEINPEGLTAGTVLKVVQNLLREQVSIRDLRTILECLADCAAKIKDPFELTEHVRVALGRAIAQQHLASDQTLYAITLPRALEEKLLQSVSSSQNGPQLALEPTLAKSVVEQIGQEAKRNMASNQPPVVLTSQQVRPHLYRLIERFIPNLAVLAHGEVAGHVKVRPVAMIGEAA